MKQAVSPLAALVGRIDREALAEAMLGTFRDEIPGYSRLPESVIRGQVLEVIRENVDLCLDWVAGGGAPDAARFDDFRESAKNRAAEGMPLEDLLRAYRIGGTAAWRVLVAEARPDERDVLPYAAELVMTYLDQASGFVAAAYLEERQHLVSEQERGLRALLDALLDGNALDSGHQVTAARLGLAISGPLAAFAVAIPGADASAHARTAAGLRTAGVLAVTEGHRVVGLAPAGRSLAGALPANSVTVIDAEVPRDELAASLADVGLGMDIALREHLAGVIQLQDVALDLLLARSPRVAADLRERVLGPLGPKEGAAARGDLLLTVSTYVQLGCNRQRTAERLHVHPNTLDHRLRRARELTDLDLDEPEDLATMVLALHES